MNITRDEIWKYSNIITPSAEVPKLWDAPLPREGAVCSLGGGDYMYEGHTYFERNMGAR
jgi:hypothetical protein